ncbi:SEL1-like repeat protein [Alysiella crassa]|uniref:Sel1 repeat n=1 Tax=Alysiella crassa TaxID=153491 RepID=A0A376BWJ1_9NEIS|nr:SEL1-like repeat protein [Alysiella crassa]UOP06630.1 SEL1-like repeat protein [Alysiella crassa]SSY81175.1 Sel1 repeat [Alysiella crassa]
MNKDNPTEQYRTMLENLPQQPENLQQLEAIAENGNAEVMYILGWCYFKGEYLEKDLDKSMYWLQKAKNEGHKQAEELLVYCQFMQLMNR